MTEHTRTDPITPGSRVRLAHKIWGDLVGRTGTVQRRHLVLPDVWLVAIDGSETAWVPAVELDHLPEQAAVDALDSGRVRPAALGDAELFTLRTQLEYWRGMADRHVRRRQAGRVVEA